MRKRKCRSKLESGWHSNRSARTAVKRLWLLLFGVVMFSYLVLGSIDTRIYHEAPPIAD
jgi:hypothetical protein